MPQRWDLTNERKFLLVMLDALPQQSIPWAAVAAGMGAGFTTESCRQHYGALRREFRRGNSATTPQTPRTASKRKRLSKAATPQDDSEEEVAPIKKSKGDGKDGGSPFIIKSEPESSGETVKLKREPRKKAMIKTEEVLKDGAINLVDDDLYDASSDDNGKGTR